MKQQTNCADCKCKSGCFSLLFEEQIESVNAKRKEVSFKAGEIICKEGTYAPHIIYVRRGIVKSYIEHNDKNVILCLDASQTFIGLEVLFEKEEFPYTTVAFEDTDVCLFEIDMFQELIKKNGPFAAAIIQTLNEKSNRVFTRMTSIARKQVHGRLADILICLSERIYKSTDFTFSLTRKDFSEITHFSVETISRAFTELNNEGIIQLKGKHIVIPDMKKLHHLSKTG